MAPARVLRQRPKRVPATCAQVMEAVFALAVVLQPRAPLDSIAIQQVTAFRRSPAALAIRVPRAPNVRLATVRSKGFAATRIARGNARLATTLPEPVAGSPRVSQWAAEQYARAQVPLAVGHATAALIPHATIPERSKPVEPPRAQQTPLRLLRPPAMAPERARQQRARVGLPPIAVVEVVRRRAVVAARATSNARAETARRTFAAQAGLSIRTGFVAPVA